MPKIKIKYPYAYDKKRRMLAEKYARGRLYSFAINGIIVPLLALYAFVASSAFTGLRNVLLHFGILHVPLYAIILLTYLFVISLPFSFYFFYLREHKYGLSRYTKKSWFSDLLKSSALGYVFFVAAALALFYFLQSQLWWLYAAIAYSVFAIFISYIFPVAIFPIFYKTKSYTDKKMIARLRKMSEKYGVRIGKVLVANESAKSTKANALFAGFGHTKRIVLFDTLIDNFTPRETETVVAHELGHYVNKDVHRGMILDIIKALVIFYLISLLVPSVQDIALLPIIVLLYTILSLLSLPFVNTYSRHREALADFFALEAAKKPEAQISTEKRLVDMALDTEKHHPLIEFLLHTHPSAYKRIKMCEEWKMRKGIKRAE